MALRKNINMTISSDINFVVENAYIKVDFVSGDKNTINITVGYYKTNESNNCFKVNSYSFNPSLDNNFIKQAYEYLKTLEEFKDAEDC